VWLSLLPSLELLCQFIDNNKKIKVRVRVRVRVSAPLSPLHARSLLGPTFFPSLNCLILSFLRFGAEIDEIEASLTLETAGYSSGPAFSTNFQPSQNFRKMTFFQFNRQIYSLRT
jgi:hypothetical protein